MGKLAGYELNFFSDIDLILVSKKPEVSQKLISKCQNFLNQLTLNLGMGKLYNVDLDLRPGGFSSPMVVTPNQLLNHLNNNCESWEYFSYIRSRNLDPRGTLKTKILNYV